MLNVKYPVFDVTGLDYIDISPYSFSKVLSNQALTKCIHYYPAIRLYGDHELSICLVDRMGRKCFLCDNFSDLEDYLRGLTLNGC